jgi:hypothetical protein
MKVVKVWCECGECLGLTKTQFADFEDGICGPLKCPKCGKKLLPIDEEINCLLEEVEFIGKDPGWDVCQWQKMIKHLMETLGRHVILVTPDGVI